MNASGKSKAWWSIANILVILYALIPLLWIISLSFKPASSVTDGKFWPSEFTLDNYKSIFETSAFTSALINSIGVGLITTVIAVLLGFSPKFGALIQTIPAPVLGGMSVVVFGLIAIAGARIWVVNQVDFSDNRNLIVAAVTLVLGAGDFTVKLGTFTLGGIGTATFGAIILYALLRRRN